MAGRSGSRSGADNDNEDWENGHWTGPTYPFADNQPARADAAGPPTPPRRPGAAKAPMHVRPRVAAPPMPHPRPVAPVIQRSPTQGSAMGPALAIPQNTVTAPPAARPVSTAPPGVTADGKSMYGLPTGDEPGVLDTIGQGVKGLFVSPGSQVKNAGAPPASYYAPGSTGSAANAAAPTAPPAAPAAPPPPPAPPPAAVAPQAQTPGVTADGKSMYGLPTGDGYAKGGPAKGSFAYAKGGAVGDTKARYKGMTHKR